MSFPAYPAYKHSGVDWLGELPAHWKSKRLKFLFQLRKRDVRGQDQIVTCFRDGTVTLRANRRTEGFTNALKEIGYQGIRVGDLVIHAMDAFAGAIGVSDSDGKSSPVYSVCVPISHDVSAQYYARLLRYMALAGFVSSLAKGIRERSTDFRWSDAAEIFLPVPPAHEQTQVACFLDHETARIDTLIAEQQCLIELLKEKRQAVIAHAVTKGLEPAVPMKDSGVEWLGEVPAHWDVVRTKHIKSWRPNAFVDGPFGSNLKSEHFVDDGGVYVIESNFATTGELSFSDLKQITPNHFETIRRSEVCPGDIVIAKIGARYGMCSILPWLDKPAVVSGNSLKLTVNEEICDSRFAVFVLQYLKERGAIEDIVNMTAQPALSLGEMNNLPFPLPSLSEQLSIVSGLDTQLGEFEALTSECKKVMSLAIERRSALISAVITGKIDVRNWQPLACAQAPVQEVEEAV